ncbi:unnamed protein product [Didymodactylos carnosus]|uniref:TNF receptor-associated factor n=1 Tax=Didymodactylos carnosus TaxID=1234261 RepID=A0A813ZE46_9BILA|nr:unnamed protein product [Didymodactylos carnosus]CAF3680713.1 unnamed protein product [Didymodactylos carnosus]
MVNGCGQLLKLDDIFRDRAIEHEMKNIDVVCYNKMNGCTWSGIFAQYQEHLNTCKYVVLICDSCDSTFTDTSVFEQHQQTCLKAIILCPLWKFGCDTKVSREALYEHTQKASADHVQIIADQLTSLINTQNRLQQQKQRPEVYLQQYSIQKQQQQQNLSSSALTMTQNSTILSLQNDLLKQSQLIEQLRNENKSLSSTLGKRDDLLSQTRVDLQLRRSDLLELRKEFELSKTFLHVNGTYLWKIDGVSQKFNDAKNGDQFFINSPIFYSSKYGYKLSAKLYLNGDQTVRNTYLSLYITINRSEYDDVLEWPFNYPITFCLYDQSLKREHILNTLTPDLQSDAFKRPVFESNKSGGIPKFCPLCKVFSLDYGYAKNNTMYIKILIDFKLYPQNIWPEWSKLQWNGLSEYAEQQRLKEDFLPTRQQ